MTLIEQLVVGALAALLSVGLVGGIMEFKQWADEQLEEQSEAYDNYLEIIDGGDVSCGTKSSK